MLTARCICKRILNSKPKKLPYNDPSKFQTIQIFLAVQLQPIIESTFMQYRRKCQMVIKYYIWWHYVQTITCNIQDPDNANHRNSIKIQTLKEFKFEIIPFLFLIIISFWSFEIMLYSYFKTSFVSFQLKRGQNHSETILFTNQ